MDVLVDDLLAETAVLRALLAPLGEEGWRGPTPAAGWSVADAVAHLAHFDAVAVRAGTDGDAFAADVADALAGPDYPDRVAQRYRDRTGADLLAWLDAERAALADVFRALDPAARVPWFGPAMSAASCLTARVMETWAHGQDVLDALGVVREPTGRLRHVAHLGVGARAYSHAVNDVPLPEAPVRVELAAPDGSTWTWGPPDAADRVRGDALDFCLLVTQRRHAHDVSLDVAGPAATTWLGIAQAFAGAPGPGRAPAPR